ncbi:hypothetical protein [Bacteroides reticulotermitis]|uniref:hypothetical protein n=1 Tax=Bacteroides reticulotermitis TaxID=1133319 RepID=UPI003A85FA2B
MKTCYKFHKACEFRHCLHAQSMYEDVSVTFEYLEFEMGSELKTNDLSKNYILAFLEGKHAININLFDTQVFTMGEMLCLPKHSKVSGKTLVSGSIVSIAFDIPLSSCDQSIIHQYLSSSAINENMITSLKMGYALTNFFKMMAYIIDNDKACIHLYKLKLDEFFILLRATYDRQDIINFLSPAVLGMTEFSIYIYRNFQKANDLQDLITDSPYSRAVFYRKFKEDFGSITPQKWFNIQKRSQFIEIGAKPGMTPKDMMRILNLNSLSTMSRLCNDLFGCTPSKLIKRLKESI